MRINSNRDNAKWINITKALLLWRVPKQNRTRFIFWKADGLKKFYGFLNCKFSIYKGADYKPWSVNNLRVFIRLPFFYWEKHNCGWEFGLPNLYLWWHEARSKKLA